MSPKRPRQLMVVLHVLTSVGWLTMALAQVMVMHRGAHDLAAWVPPPL